MDRKIEKDCHKAMTNDRGLQTRFNNLVGGARFKALVGNTLMKAKCPKKDVVK